MLEKNPTHSDPMTNFEHFRGKSSCERTERHFFNGLQVQLHKIWPNTGNTHEKTDSINTTWYQVPPGSTTGVHIVVNTWY